MRSGAIPPPSPSLYSANMADDFNRLRMIAKRTLEADYQQQWQWRVEVIPSKHLVDEAGSDLTYGLFKPVKDLTDFDLLAKSIDHDPITIGSEPVRAGAITLNYPNASEATTINLTMRDSFDGAGNPRFYKFFKHAAQRVFNTDGTINLPFVYLMTIKLYPIDSLDPMETYQCFPQKLGNWSASVDGPGLIEYPATFMQFRSLGKVML